MEWSELAWADAVSWPYIGYIQAYFPDPEYPGGYSVGTGSLIGPRLVLTAGHIVFDPLQGGKARDFVVRFGGPAGLACRTRQAETTTQWRDRDAYADVSSVSAFDVGVIVLPEAVDRYVAPLPFQTASDSMLAGMTLNVAGYPAYPAEMRGTLYGGRFHLLQDGALPAIAASLESFRLFYPAATVPGMSGGPVYDFDPVSGIRTLRGIHTSSPPWIGLGSALRIAENIYELLLEWTAAYRP